MGPDLYPSEPQLDPVPDGQALELTPDPVPSTPELRAATSGTPLDVDALIQQAQHLEDAYSPSAELLRRALDTQNEMIGTGAPAPGLDPEVDRAVALIQGNLRQGVANDVTHRELGEIERAIEGLSPSKATAAVGRLSDAELETWMDEVNSGALGPWAGYDRDEQARLYGTLAERLDARQLLRLAQAIDDGTAPGSVSASFGAEVSAHAQAGVRLAFVRDAAPLVGSDAEVALATGEVLGGLRGFALNQALEYRLSPEQLQDVVEASVRTRFNPPTGLGGGGSLTINTDTLERVLDAVALSDNPLAKAYTVAEASRRLQEIDDAGGLMVPAFAGNSVAEVRAGITGVIESDPVGVIGQLERYADREGRAAVSYVRSMIEDGQTAELGQLLVRLATRDGAGDARALFGRGVVGDNGARHYDHAENLGYVAGIVEAAVEDITSNRREQADLLKNIFGTAAGVAGAGGPGAGVVGTVLAGLSGEAVDAIFEGVARNDRSLSEALVALTFPSGYEGAPEGFYGEARSRTRLANHTH